ncbi:DUF4163 domain-containing protein [Sphingopyxis sp. MWB1]|uniref:DUF4163 domain-containing protein n=1 Tax=Sphingopyxis sp. MWB1 TaxID=1537715 RepID=UPI0009E02702|nr:DUF4163 domain-containing protein [Sphingopyxis sp. MWB1]
MSLFLVPLAISVSACSAGSEAETPPATKANVRPVPGAPPAVPAEVPAQEARASEVKEENDLIHFAYSYPREAAAIPKLAAWLDADREAKREALINDSRRDKASAEQGGYPYRAHSHLQTWKLVTSTPRFVSLSSEIGTYTGGAHGMQSFDTLIWDRNRAMQIKPLDMFTSASAFDAAIRDKFCAGIERAKATIGVEPTRDADSPFAKCPPASAQTVWIGSSDGKYLDRLTIAIAPYEVGPYAEGSYLVNIPMTGALVKAVKPEYAREFLPIN